VVAPDDARVRERAQLERIKELELRHRNRLRASGFGAALSFRFARTFVRRLLSRTRRAPADPIPHPAPGALAVTLVGHATVMITSPEARVLTDPLLDDALYGLRRVVAARLAPEDRDDVSLVLVSHAHGDHLRAASLRRLPRAATLVVPPRTAELVARLGFVEVRELAPGDSLRHRDLTIAAVPARHPGGGPPIPFGWRPACGYVIASPDASCYFAGDTGYFSGFADIGRRFRPDVALLPITGYDPFPLRATHLSPLDAVFALEDLGARLCIPIAHGSFPLGYEPPDEPLAWLREAAAERGVAERLAVLGNGESCVVRRHPGAA
jgi:L-ascorbate metabolism protein UlaG (beta-lactamase superfamily)